MYKTKNLSPNIFKIYCKNCIKYIYSICEIKICPECFVEFENDSELVKSSIEEPKPKSIVITKSFGVLDPRTYSNQDILHVGISDSKANIFNFWNSYKIEKITTTSIWKNVLNIELNFELINDEVFDDHLKLNMLEQKKLFPRYHQFNNNCYDYVCRFLNYVNYLNNNWTKESLAVFLIEPQIIKFEKFCYVYKKLNDSYTNDDYLENYFVEDPKYSQFTYSICDHCNNRIIQGKRNRCLTCKDFDLCDECLYSFGHEHGMSKM